MKYLAAIFTFSFLLFPVFTQTTGPKKAEKAKAAAKPTPKKKGATAKARSTPTKTTASKPRSTPSKTALAAKPKTTPAKTNSAKPKPTPTPKSVADEKAEFEKAAAVEDAAKRIIAVHRFLADFPNTKRRNEGLELIVTSEAAIGNAAIQAGNVKAASTAFMRAAQDTPKPVTEQLFSDTLSKFPANLFWRGERDAAFEIAKILEEKCDANPTQLLAIAGFYMSVEDGAEAKRLANAAIALAPNSSAAYQTMGLADRIDFQLEESAVAYAKALELEPDSLSARRGLAEMKRALGKPDEAADLYRQILAKDESNLPARTGLIMALFEGGKRADAESEMASSLEANPGNIVLLAGAAYWYAANNEGQKAIETAQKAIATDPRFIWSHIALARGYLAQRRPIDAEKTLLAARRYGNFPTLEYEIASSRLMAGFYREAAEELSKSFAVKDGMISTKLGGRVPKESADFIELLASERRASISAPTSADTPENAAQLRALLDLWTKLGSKDTDAEALGKAADEFVRGDDKMKVHRELFAAKELLDRNKDYPKVVELAKAAIGNADSALDVPSPGAAIMADELYDSRRLAVTRDEYILIPDVPTATLSAILRGRIEYLSGWALFQMDDTAESIVRLKRAVSVLPASSAWWRTATWRLGSALESSGKGAEALEAYIKCYKSGPPDLIKYTIIESLYKRLNGSTDGLGPRIGPSPERMAPTEVVAQKVEPSPTSAPAPTPAVPSSIAQAIGDVPAVKPTPEPSTSPTPEAVKVEPTPEATPTPSPEAVKVEPTPEPKPTPTPDPAKVEPTPEPSPSPTPDAAKVKPTPEPSPTPTPEAVKVEPTPEPSPSPTPDAAKVEPTPEPSPTPTPEAVKVQPTPEPIPSPTPEAAKAEPTPMPSPSPTADDAAVAKVIVTAAKVPDEKPTADPKSATTPKELFPPVIITIPAPDKDLKKAEPKAEATPSDKKEPDGSKASEPSSEAKPANRAPDPTDTRLRIVDPKPADQPSPCSVTLSEASLTLENNGGDLAVIVGTEDDRDVTGVGATSNSPNDVDVRLEPISGIKGRALFVVRSVSTKTGVYQITFALPCGKKNLIVKVR